MISVRRHRIAWGLARALPLLALLAGLAVYIHRFEIESCERVNVLRDVVGRALETASDRAERGGDAAMQAEVEAHLASLRAVPFTDGEDVTVDCGEAYSPW